MQPPLTDADLAAKIKRECSSGDLETDHLTADYIVKQQLESLNYPLAAAAWDNVEKWYA